MAKTAKVRMTAEWAKQGYIGRKMWSRDKRFVGQITAEIDEPCVLNECPGTQVKVKWNSGKTTRVCMRGVDPHYSGFRIA